MFAPGYIQELQILFACVQFHDIHEWSQNPFRVSPIVLGGLSFFFCGSSYVITYYMDLHSSKIYKSLFLFENYFMLLFYKTRSDYVIKIFFQKMCSMT